MRADPRDPPGRGPVGAVVGSAVVGEPAEAASRGGDGVDLGVGVRFESADHVGSESSIVLFVSLRLPIPSGSMTASSDRRPATWNSNAISSPSRAHAGFASAASVFESRRRLVPSMSRRQRSSCRPLRRRTKTRRAPLGEMTGPKSLTEPDVRRSLPEPSPSMTHTCEVDVPRLVYATFDAAAIPAAASPAARAAAARIRCEGAMPCPPPMIMTPGRAGGQGRVRAAVGHRI